MVDKSPPDRIRTITIAPVGLEGLLGLPMDPTGIVLFAPAAAAAASARATTSLPKRCVTMALPHCSSTC